MIATLISLCMAGLLLIAAASSVHEQKLKKRRARRADLMKKQSRVMHALERLLENQESLPLSHFMYSQLHFRMTQCLSFMQELAREMQLPAHYQSQLQQKHDLHSSSYDMHEQRAADEDVAIQIPDFGGDRAEQSMQAAYMMSRVLKRCGASNISAHERFRAEIERMDAIGHYFKCLKSRVTADRFFDMGHFQQSKSVYIKIIQFIETELNNNPAAQDLLAATLSFCKSRADTLSLLAAKDAEPAPLVQSQGDGLNRFFDAKKNYDTISRH